MAASLPSHHLATDHLASTLVASFAELLPSSGDLASRLVERWAEPWRGYHNLVHLQEALDALSRLGGGQLELLAIWFHDAVYGLGAGVDERESANLAGEWLPLAGVSAADVTEVQRLVLITEHHQPAIFDAGGARVSDADMAILASPPQRYAESVAGIRREYARFDDATFNAGRIQVLQGFLSQPRIFHTSLGHSWWEDAARRNIAAELAERRACG